MEQQENRNEVVNIPYIVYESAQTRMERTIKKLIIALVIAIILIFASNIAWLYAWCQYDYSSTETTTTYQQDGEGMNNINTGTQGDVENGAESINHSQDENPNPQDKE